MHNSSAQQIFPYRLWVGSEYDVHNMVARLGSVTLIVNCSRDVLATHSGIRSYQVPLDDTTYDPTTLMQYIPNAVLLIDDHLAQGGTVLIICRSGRTRSPSLAASYLMYKEGISASQAMARVQQVRPNVYTWNINFMPALERFYFELKTNHGYWYRARERIPPVPIQPRPPHRPRPIWPRWWDQGPGPQPPVQAGCSQTSPMCVVGRVPKCINNSWSCVAPEQPGCSGPRIQCDPRKSATAQCVNGRWECRDISPYGR